MGNSIQSMRNLLKMTQQVFSSLTGIPIGTIRNWEQGKSSPPEYVYTMLYKILSEENMVNVATIKFVSTLNQLAELSANGIDEFANANEGNYDQKIFYNKKKTDDDGNYFVVQDACIVDDVDCMHHDAISYYGTNDYTVRVVIDDHGMPFVKIKFAKSNDKIVVENGRWYFA